MYRVLNDEIKEYYKILSPDFPEWLNDYINTPEMLRLDYINMSCATYYTKVYNDLYDYSNLNHSVGVALIVWNFTKDKKQTLAGLFHDISTPVFKHCIDFMNGDTEVQESTEERTESIIKNSKEIIRLLKRDNINVEDVIDYKMYPIADNSSPQLSADRLEYTLSDGLYQERIFELDDIRKFYNNLKILKNERGIAELGFMDAKICEEFICRLPKLWYHWVEDRICMQYIADLVKSMYIKGYITVDDLYILTENEIIKRIQNCEDQYIKEAFIKYQNATRDDLYESDEINPDIYCTDIKVRKRYIKPLVMTENRASRITDVSANANETITNFLNMKICKYIGFKFDFKPYKNISKK